MANPGAPNSGYGPDNPSQCWNAQRELKIDTWNPSAAANSASADQQPWQNSATSPVPPYQSNATHYGQGDIDSNWGNQMSVPSVGPQVSFYDPSAPPAGTYQQTSGYSGQVMNPSQDMYQQYKPGQASSQQQYYNEAASNFPPQMYSNDVAWGSGYSGTAQPQTRSSSGYSQYQNFANDDHHGRRQPGFQSEKDSFHSVKSFKNPLMQSGVNDVEDAAGLIRNMHIEGQKAQQQMQNNVSFPKVLSTASLAMIKQNLDEAAIAFQSPEALQRARDRVLGICNLDDVGSEVVVSNLSVAAPSFVPRAASAVRRERTLASKDEEEQVVADLEKFIKNVLTHPGSFDNLSAVYVNRVRNYLHSNETVKEMVDIIFTKAINEDNFKYLGARLCDSLTTSDVLTNFRSILLTHFQAEFKKMIVLLEQNEKAEGTQEEKNAKGVEGQKDTESPGEKGVKTEAEKDSQPIESKNNAEETNNKSNTEEIEGFILFMAEIFLHIKINGAPIKALGRSFCKTLENLLACPTARKVNFVCKLLKLTGGKLLDAFEKNETDMMNYQKAFTILNEFSQKQQGKTDEESKRTQLLISSVCRLKQVNWGRTLSNTRKKSSIDNPEQFGEDLSEVDQNYYMNEPVFFTPDGVQYTAAEAQIPEFYDQHLAKFVSTTDDVTDDVANFPWSHGNDGGIDDLIPSDEEADYYKLDSEDSEYNAEFEKFLAESNQL